MTGLYKYGGAACALLVSVTAPAQPRVEAQLQAVPKEGFYRVTIGRDIGRYARPDLADLRLRDGRGAPVPYRVDTVIQYGSHVFTPFPILSITHDSSASTLVLSVPGSSSRGFHLSFRNTDAQRYASITGSYDGKTWYSLRDNFPVAPQPDDATNFTAVENITYPSNNYPLLRLRLLNGRNAPLDALSAGVYDAFPGTARRANLGRLQFRQQDSAGATYVYLQNPGRERLEEIRLHIPRPRYFTRNATLTEAGTGRSIAAAVLTDRQPVFPVEATRYPELVLRMENGANPALQIDSITGGQRVFELLAYLEKGGTYTLAAGDSNAQAPVYDLSGFRSPATDSASPLGYRAVRVFPVRQKASDNRAWIWIALGAGILVLGWFSYSLLRDVREEKERRSL